MFIKYIKAKAIKTNSVSNQYGNQQSNEKNKHHQNNKNKNLTDLNALPLKDRFLIAVVNGEIGRVENSGVIVSLKEFKAHFTDIKSDYINSFLPAATIEPGMRSVSQTKYLFRVKKGVYLVHPEVLVGYQW